MFDTLAVVVEKDFDELEAEIKTLAAHRYAADCRWLLLVAEFDRRKGYERWECRTTAHWLNWHCGVSFQAARDHVRVGRALESLPLVVQTPTATSGTPAARNTAGPSRGLLHLEDKYKRDVEAREPPREGPTRLRVTAL